MTPAHPVPPNQEGAPSMTDTHPRPEWLDRAEAERLLAEKAKAEAEARKLAAEAEEAEHKAAKARIDLDREQHKRARELSADEYHHTYLFAGSVSSDSVQRCISQLSHWERSSPGDEPLTVDLHINSPGGGIFEGFALVDHIAGMHARGHTVNTTAYGMAASMGGVILQIGKTRRMGSNAALLIHEASFGAGGKTGEIEDEVALVHMLQDRILDLYAERAKISGAPKPMSRTQIRNHWRRRDWWISAPDCLKHGFIDQIVA